MKEHCGPAVRGSEQYEAFVVPFPTPVSITRRRSIFQDDDRSSI